MQQRGNIGGAYAVMAIIAAGIAVMFNILLHNTGGISGLVLYFGGALCVVCLVMPTKGIFVLGFFCFYLDFVKKLAVVYGVASMNTVIEVLVVQLLALAGVVLGTLIRLALFDHRLTRRHVNALALTGVVTIVTYLLYRKQGATAALQAAANNGAYIGMILVCLVSLEERQKMVRYLDYLYWLAVPWAAYGVVQSTHGFADFEWEYARTGLSAVSSSAMLYFEKPRPFGFASGEAGYSVLMLTQAYGMWRIVATNNCNKVLWALATLTVSAGLVVSLQRTVLILPVEILVVSFIYRSRMATTIAYATGAMAFLTAVLFSDQLMEGLSVVDNSVNLKGDWAQRVVKVSTWADRLQGWQHLKRLDAYTVFGKRWTDEKFSNGLVAGDTDGGHDLINPTLNNFGVVGLIIVFGIPIWLLRRTHRYIWAMPDGENRHWAMFLLATTVVYLGQSSVGGSNLGATPINLVIWTFMGCLVVTIMRQPEGDTLTEATDGPAPLLTVPKFRPVAGMAVPPKGRMPAFRKSGAFRHELPNG